MEKKRHIQKSNNLVNGRYRFGVNEQKILLAIISKIRLSDNDFTPYRVSWSLLKEITNGRIKSVQDLNKTCEGLKNRTVLLKQGKITHGFGFLSSWTICPGLYAEFTIAPKMRDLLLNLLENGNFTLYRLESVLGLRSTYSLRMYEILKSHQWKGSVVISMDDLHWSLDVDSVSLNRFNNFRIRVLERAKKDLAKHTDIKFTYKKVLKDRAVAAIEFTIMENKKVGSAARPAHNKKEVIQNGDIVILEGNEFKVEGDCIRIDGSPLPLGKLNVLLKKGIITKL